jgi:hypothetical protein
LAERSHVAREEVRVSEFGERQPRRCRRRGAAGDELQPAVIEVLRELFDNLGFPRRRES